MKQLIAFCVLATALSPVIGVSRAIEDIMKTPVKELTPGERAIRSEHMRKVKLRIFGEDVVRPDSQQGRIVFVNAQRKLPQAEIEAAVGTLYKNVKFNFEVKTDNREGSRPIQRASSACGDFNAQIAVVVVDDAETPAVLVAFEDQWAIVNVSKMDRGLKPGPLYTRLFAARCRKEIIRSFSLLCGGGASQFPGNMMDAPGIEELDSVQEFIPIDMERRWRDCLARRGVKPAHIRTYQQACQEGWAPAPTNDIQRAIWNKIHAVPNRPITIEFDPKRDTPGPKTTR